MCIRDRGVTVFEITLIESVSMLLCILLEIPWGMVADRIGYKKTMVLSNLIFFASKLIFWQATSFAGFLAERILLSFAAVSYTHLDVYKRQQCPWAMLSAGLVTAAFVHAASAGSPRR